MLLLFMALAACSSLIWPLMCRFPDTGSDANWVQSMLEHETVLCWQSVCVRADGLVCPSGAGFGYFIQRQARWQPAQSLELCLYAHALTSFDSVLRRTRLAGGGRPSYDDGGRHAPKWRGSRKGAAR